MPFTFTTETIVFRYEERRVELLLISLLGGTGIRGTVTNTTKACVRHEQLRRRITATENRIAWHNINSQYCRESLLSDLSRGGREMLQHEYGRTTHTHVYQTTIAKILQQAAAVAVAL